MAEIQKLSDWRDKIRYSPEGPQHHVLVDTGSYRSVLVGLEAGAKIPPHPSSDATYHVLQGSGWMLIDGERHPIQGGTTMVVPAGVERGMEAETRLAFLGSHGGHGAPATNDGHASHSGKNRPRVMMLMFALMAVSMLVVMVGLMQIGASPMAMMFSGFGNMGLGVWGTMLVPMLGLLGMLIMMVFMGRMMLKGSGMMGMGKSSAQHSAMMHQRHGAASESIDPSLQSATFSIPGISCGGCKQTIEGRVGELEGVATVLVNVENRKAVIRYASPATPEKIEMLLSEIGYPAAV